MTLFGSKEKKIVSAKKIRPTVKRVQNVAKELLALAGSNEVKVETIDFNILDVQTYTRIFDGVKETEWEEIFRDEIYELDDMTALLNPNFQIKQMYELEFFTKTIENTPFESFNIAVGANATKCKVYLSIKENSEISYSQKLEIQLINLINKSKIRSGILIYIFDQMVDEAVSKLLAYIRVQSNVKYIKNETILIAKSYEPTLTIDDEVILHYDKKEEVDEHQKMDYGSRDFIQNVKKDELLIEYIKAKTGKPGRNCRGEFMSPKAIEEKFSPRFTFDDTIRKEDSPKSIKYFANENGYISLNKNVYSIKTDVDMKQISFKTTGNITSGLDSDVTINVSEKDSIKDAIGMGMEIEVTEIDIDGNVGSNAQLRAVKASINGQTHKTSQVRADKLNINVHKGKAYGKKIYITRLEHGIIDGDEVEVSQAIGGNIRAKEIVIGHCASHVKATASRSIEIKKLRGSENTFTIDPLLKKSTRNNLGENNNDIKDLELQIKELKTDLDLYTTQIDNGTAAFLDVKKRLLHYKKNGIKMPDSFIKKYKNFQKVQEHLKSIKENYEFKNNELDILKSKTSIFQDDIMYARIINRDKWHGYNELIFKLIDPPLDVIFKPPEGFSGKIFGLVEVSDGVFEIQALDK